MSKQVLAVFIASEPSLWVSCNSIGPNLIRCYEQLADDDQYEVKWFNVTRREENLDLRLGTGYLVETAQKVLASGATDIVFLDHHVNPLPMLVALKSCAGATFKKLRFCFHIYGDFTLFPERWIEIGRALRGCYTKFICASERQRGLVSFFEHEGRSVASLCPFPVNTERFKFSQKFRHEVRAELGLNETHTLMLYTGRLSLQKCIVKMVDEFERLAHSGYSQLVFALAGPYDDLGGLTSGIHPPRGFYFHELESRLKSLTPALRKRVLLLGDFAHEGLRKLYSAADLFFSLSLHHDEDFGMCPAEAFSSGLRAILNDWGGYASFRDGDSSCRLVPVQLNSRGLSMNDKSIRRHLEELLAAPRPNARERLTLGREFAKRFGIDAVADRLRSELRADTYQVALGFDWSLEMVCNTRAIKGEVYTDVYRRYVES